MYACINFAKALALSTVCTDTIPDIHVWMKSAVTTNPLRLSLNYKYIYNTEKSMGHFAHLSNISNTRILLNSNALSNLTQCNRLQSIAI